MSYRQLHGWILIPLTICALGAHNQPEVQQFESLNIRVPRSSILEIVHVPLINRKRLVRKIICGGACLAFSNPLRFRFTGTARKYASIYRAFRVQVSLRADPRAALRRRLSCIFEPAALPVDKDRTQICVKIPGISRSGFSQIDPRAADTSAS